MTPKLRQEELQRDGRAVQFKDLPNAGRWLSHLKEDLLPFWDTETALGTPVGDFPTFRLNNGEIPTADDPRVKDFNPDVVDLEHDYVRAKSRQCYAYGVAYHMTGDVKYLGYAKAGIDFIRQHCLHTVGVPNPAHKAAYTYWSKTTRQWGPELERRTSQDLAYALMGPALYYYLTRDPDVLSDILAVKNYIFDNYFDSAFEWLYWTLEPPEPEHPYRRELIAVLDQISAYMILLTPILPQPHRDQWKQELQLLASRLIRHFYSQQCNLFWGVIDRTEDKRYGERHVDFGHSIKSCWMLYKISNMVGDSALNIFAREKAATLLEQAFLPPNEGYGSWARAFNKEGVLDQRKEWWIYAELDQMAANLTLIDPVFSSRLIQTYNYWLTHMVDHEHGEVWHMVNADDTPDASMPKQHIWKNAFHSFEHALVGYICCQHVQNQQITLYFAFSEDPDPGTITPYNFSGKLRRTDSLGPISFLPGYEITRAIFAEAR
jgi:mannose/cellobiose epimerase-like protein (N-acyl-D-glucosamine 2-epimerase family)